MENQHPAMIDANVLRATKLMRFQLEQIEAMQKLKAKAGQQEVTVEHVHVHEGGQRECGSGEHEERRGGRQCPAIENGRCRLHGGLSTGPKTLEDIERIRRAVMKHGNYSKLAKTERAEYRALLRACREMLTVLS
jgi:hypothetical protein